MPRTGSIFNQPTQEETDAWVRQKVKEYERDVIAKLRAERAAAPRATPATQPQQTIYLNAPMPTTPRVWHYIITSNSDPKKSYTVCLYPDGNRGECECFGFKFRRKCSHIDEAQALHDAGLGGLDD